MTGRYAGVVIDLVSSESEHSDGDTSDIEVISRTPHAPTRILTIASATKRAREPSSSVADSNPRKKPSTAGDSQTALGVAVKREPMGFGEADIGDEVVELPLPSSAMSGSSCAHTPAGSTDLAGRLASGGGMVMAVDVDVDSDDDIAFVGGNMTVMSEMAHQREACSRFPFDRMCKAIATNRLHCDNCFCYVCDVPVRECSNWDTHCQATVREPRWKTIKEQQSRAVREMKYLADLFPDAAVRAAYLREEGELLRGCSEFRGVDDLLSGRGHPAAAPFDDDSGYDSDEYGYGDPFSNFMYRMVGGGRDYTRSSRRSDALSALHSRIARMQQRPMDAAGQQRVVALLCELMAVRQLGDSDPCVSDIFSAVIQALVHVDCTPHMAEIICRCFQKAGLSTQFNKSFLPELVGAYPNGVSFSWLYDSSEPMPVKLTGMTLNALTEFVGVVAKLDVLRLDGVFGQLEDPSFSSNTNTAPGASSSSSSSSSSAVQIDKAPAKVRADFHEMMLKCFLESPLCRNKAFGVCAAQLNSATVATYATKITEAMTSLIVQYRPLSAFTLSQLQLFEHMPLGAGNCRYGVAKAMIRYMHILLHAKAHVGWLHDCLGLLGCCVDGSMKLFPAFTDATVDNSHSVGAQRIVKDLPVQILQDSADVTPLLQNASDLYMAQCCLLFLCCACVPRFDSAVAGVVLPRSPDQPFRFPLDQSIFRKRCIFLRRCVLLTASALGVEAAIDGLLGAFVQCGGDMESIDPGILAPLSTLAGDGGRRLYFNDTDIKEWVAGSRFLSTSTLMIISNIMLHSSSSAVITRGITFPGYVKSFWCEITPLFFRNPDSDGGTTRKSFFVSVHKGFDQVTRLDHRAGKEIYYQGPSASWLARLVKRSYVDLDPKSLEFEESEVDALKDCPSFGLLLYFTYLVSIRSILVDSAHDSSKVAKAVALLPRVVVAIHRFVYGPLFGSRDVSKAAWQLWRPLIACVCPSEGAAQWGGNDYFNSPWPRVNPPPINVIAFRVLYDQPVLTDQEIEAPSTELVRFFNSAVIDLARGDLTAPMMQHISRAITAIAPKKPAKVMGLVTKLLYKRPNFFPLMKKSCPSGLCAVALAVMSPELAVFALRRGTEPLRGSANQKAAIEEVLDNSFHVEMPYIVPTVDAGGGLEGSGPSMSASFRSQLLVNAKLLPDGHNRMLLLALLEPQELGSELKTIQKLFGVTEISHCKPLIITMASLGTSISHSRTCSYTKCKQSNLIQRSNGYTCQRCIVPLYCSVKCGTANHSKHGPMCTGKDAPNGEAREFRMAIAVECLVNLAFSGDDVLATLERVLPPTIEYVMGLSLFVHSMPRFGDFVRKLHAVLSTVDCADMTKQLSFCVDVLKMLCAPNLRSVQMVLRSLQNQTDSECVLGPGVANGPKRVLLWVKESYRMRTSAGVDVGTPGVAGVFSVIGLVDYFSVAAMYFGTHLSGEDAGTAWLADSLPAMDECFFPAGWGARAPDNNVVLDEGDWRRQSAIRFAEDLCKLALSGPDEVCLCLASLVSLLLLSPWSPCVCAIEGVSVSSSRAEFYYQSVSERRRRIREVVALDKLRASVASLPSSTRHQASVAGAGQLEGARAAVRTLSATDLLFVLEFLLHPSLGVYTDMTTSSSAPPADSFGITGSSAASRLLLSDEDVPDLRRLAELTPLLFNHRVFYAVIFDPADPAPFLAIALRNRDIGVLTGTMGSRELPPGARQIYLKYLSDVVSVRNLQLDFRDVSLGGLSASADGSRVISRGQVTWEHFLECASFRETFLSHVVLQVVCASCDGTELDMLCASVSACVIDALFLPEQTAERAAASVYLKALSSQSLRDVIACSQLEVRSGQSLMGKVMALVIPEQEFCAEEATAPQGWCFARALQGMAAGVRAARLPFNNVLSFLGAVLSFLHGTELCRVTSATGSAVYLLGNDLQAVVPDACWKGVLTDAWEAVSVYSDRFDSEITAVLAACCLCTSGRPAVPPIAASLALTYAFRHTINMQRLFGKVALFKELDKYCRLVCGPLSDFSFLGMLSNTERDVLSFPEADFTAGLKSAIAHKCLAEWAAQLVAYLRWQPIPDNMPLKLRRAEFLTRMAAAAIDDGFPETSREMRVGFARDLLDLQEGVGNLLWHSIHTLYLPARDNVSHDVSETILFVHIPTCPPADCVRGGRLIRLVVQFYGSHFADIFKQIVSPECPLNQRWTPFLRELCIEFVYQQYYGSGNADIAHQELLFDTKVYQVTYREAGDTRSRRGFSAMVYVFDRLFNEYFNMLKERMLYTVKMSLRQVLGLRLAKIKIVFHGAVQFIKNGLGTPVDTAMMSLLSKLGDGTTWASYGMAIDRLTRSKPAVRKELMAVR